MHQTQCGEDFFIARKSNSYTVVSHRSYLGGPFDLETMKFRQNLEMGRQK